MNIPNKLTVLRIILIPVFVAFFFIKAIPLHFIWALAVFVIASITDFLDGFIARKYNLVTTFGKFLDPIADKILVSTALILLVVEVFDEGVFMQSAILPWYAGIMVAVIMARELMISGFRMIAASKNKVISADKSGKVKTFTQDVSIIMLLICGALIELDCLPIILYWISFGVFGLATLLTVYSGIECLVKNKEVLKD